LYVGFLITYISIFQYVTHPVSWTHIWMAVQS
jgi:hypothetical protein